MGLLSGSSAYLIGAIDHAEDPRKWRKEIAQDLLLPMGVKIYDPLLKPGWFLNMSTCLGESFEEIRLFKNFLSSAGTSRASLDPSRHPTYSSAIENRMVEIRKLCLSMANNADFIIGKLPKQFTVGTMEELAIAASAGKPILLHLPDGFDTSTWLPAQIGKSFFNNSFLKMEELYERIRLIDSGEADVNNFEWIFLSYFNDKEVIDEFASYQQIRNQSSQR